MRPGFVQPQPLSRVGTSMSAPGNRLVVYAAAIGNALIAVTKFAAAGYTGSSAMLSEAVHSVADTGNQLLLLYGMHRAKQPPDEQHPLGHGRELYFWSFIVALIMFTLGAGVACYEGVRHILHPIEVSAPIVNYVVLGCAFVFEGASWTIALREFRHAKGSMGYYNEKEISIFLEKGLDPGAITRRCGGARIP